MDILKYQKELQEKNNLTDQEMSEAMSIQGCHISWEKDPKTGEFLEPEENRMKAETLLRLESYLDMQKK